MIRKNNIVYLDNAASSFPKPPSVIKEVQKLLKKNTSNPGRSGHFMSKMLSDKVYEARKNLADFFGTDEELIIFTQNATHAINQLLKGLLERGDHVLISDMEHNAVLRPLCELNDEGVDFDIFSSPEMCEKLIRPATKLIFCTVASNVTGDSLPIKKLAEIAKRKNVFLGVDAAQSAGVIDTKLKRDDIDFLCATSHKSLLGIQGSGVLAMKKYVRLKPLISGGTGTDSLSMFQPTVIPEGLESGTLNCPGIIGLSAAVIFIEKNRDEFLEKEANLYLYAYERLSERKNIKIYSSELFTVPTLAFNVGTFHSETICENLSEKGICIRSGYHCSLLAHKKLKTLENGVCRISFSPFNEKRDIDRLLEAL